MDFIRFMFFCIMDFIRFMFFGIFLIVIFLSTIFVPTYYLSKYQCIGYMQATGKQTKLVAGDCYIQDDGKWYLWEEYKNRLVTKGTM